MSMLKKRIIAGVIIKENQVVQSISYRNYLPLGKPPMFVQNLDRWQADEILINVIDRSKFNKGPDLNLLKKLKNLNIQTPLIYGGGISKIEDAVQVIQLGADRILIESLAHENILELRKISNKIGSQSIIVSIPLSINKDNNLVFYDYKKKIEKKINESFFQAIDSSVCSELLIIDYLNQGTENGFNTNILKKFSSDLPIILYGGIRNKKLIREIIKNKKVSALTFGNSLSFVEHSIQKIKYISSKKYSREPFFHQK